MKPEVFRKMLAQAFRDFSSECEYSDQVNFDRFFEWLQRYDS